MAPQERAGMAHTWQWAGMWATSHCPLADVLNPLAAKLAVVTKKENEVWQEIRGGHEDMMVR